MATENPVVSKVLENYDIDLLQKPDLHAALALHINQLILHSFDELIYLLYRVDVNEQKLRDLLNDNKGADAANMIASLIIDRQIKKIISRRENRRDDNISEEERW